MKYIKKIIAAILTGMLILTSVTVVDGAVLNVQAVDNVSIKQLENLFPIGSVLYSDSFPGFLISFNHADSYEIKEGKNDITLNITMLDKQSASKSAVALQLIFGSVKLPSKVGETTSVSGNVKGIPRIQYEELVLKTGNKDLYKLAQVLSGQEPSKAKELLRSFVNSLSDVVNYYEYTEKNESTAEDSSRNVAAEIAQVANAVNSGSSVAPDKTADAGKEVPSDKKEDEPSDSNKGESSDNSNDGNDEKDDDDKEEPEIHRYARTIMVYLDGTDLEVGSGFGTINMLDLLRANIPDNTKVFIVTGGTRIWHMNDIKSYKNYVREILYPDKSESDLTQSQKKAVEEMANELLSKYSAEIAGLQLWEVENNGTYNYLVNRETYNERYITDPAFFSDMIDYGATYAPADKYDFVIWDHGSGLRGYGDDQLLDDYQKANKDAKNLPSNTYTLKQIKEAINGSNFIKNGGKFDFIGFDACQMGNYEVITTLAPYTDYYIGSEENEPGRGWDYLAFMNAIGNNPEISTPDLGKEIINSFIKQYKDGQSTLSLVDMSKISELDNAISGFANALLAETEKSDKAYFNAISSVGTKSHFATKNGYSSSNYLDLKRFVKLFVNSQKNYSDELRSAGQKVLNRLDECVLENKWLESGVENGGISIYFPISAYYTRPDEKNKGFIFTNNTASDTIAIYNNVGINDDYKNLVARLALLNLAGKLVGQDWVDKKIVTKDDLVKAITKDEYNSKEWQNIYNSANVNEQDTNDTTLRTFEKILEDRITAEKISVTLPEDNYMAATVEVTGTDPVLVGDTVDVFVDLYFGNEPNSPSTTIGNTPIYSGSRTELENGASYEVYAFNHLWYLLENQICSMFVTKTEADGSYSGYIPVCYWVEDKDASTVNQGTMTRNEYLKKAAEEGKVTTVFLNVRATVDTNNSPIFKIDGYSSIDDNGSIGINNQDKSYLTNRFYELLGGAEEFYSITETPTVCSIGTIYYGEEDPTLRYDYVGGLGAGYYITDAFGTDYYLNDDNLGKGKGMYDFILDIPKDVPDDEITNWEKSQQEAERIRKKAEGGNIDDQAVNDSSAEEASTEGTSIDEASSAGSSNEEASSESSLIDDASTGGASAEEQVDEASAGSSGETDEAGKSSSNVEDDDYADNDDVVDENEDDDVPDNGNTDVASSSSSAAQDDGDGEDDGDDSQQANTAGETLLAQVLSVTRSLPSTDNDEQSNPIDIVPDDDDENDNNNENDSSGSSGTTEDATVPETSGDQSDGDSVPVDDGGDDVANP
jgi:hypothetical protein